ncbi:hypothetical protein EW145_g6076 [Phellinidium pouzarii]|uniref:Uncharacterized protein n=1 Tax=Phellinidium pouzarii TaxID=167371 RepID=A0A4S4KZM3_9AGAM|nr:hypothetical protein EW145_g6076 [Phellinidium pouzarii]
MRSRRRRAHLRRQDDIVYQPGAGLLLNNVGQNESQNQDDTSLTAGNQQPGGSTVTQSISVTSGTQAIAGHSQTQIQSLDSSSSQAVSSDTSAVDPISTIFFAPSSLSSVVSASTSLPSSLSSSSSDSSSGQAITSSITLSATSNIVSNSPSSVTTSGASVASLNASQSSSPVLPITNVNAAGHTTVFYGGIVFISIVVFACILSFAAWMLRSQRNRPAWCGGGREDDDVENQDLGFGLGIYLEKPMNGTDPPKASSTSLSDAAHTVPHINPFVLPPVFGFNTSSPGRYPTTMARPPTAHHDTADTAESPRQLLGSLQVNNYMPGDFSSSCDEAAPRETAPRFKDPLTMGLGTPREALPGVTPRFLALGGQGLSMPWAPLNVKPSRAFSKADIAQSSSRKSDIMHTTGEGEVPPLPMPPFSDTLSLAGEGGGGADGWGAALRSSIFNALSGLTNGSARPVEDKFTAIPASSSRSNRWRGALSSSKDSGTGMAPSSSRSDRMGDAWTSPRARDNDLPFSQSRVATVSLDAGALSFNEFSTQGDCSRIAPTEPTTPLRLQKKGTTQRRGDFFRTPIAGGGHSLEVLKMNSKGRSALSHTSLGRPAFLRNATGGSLTSFSSEESETSRDLTHDELLAKRMLMLRARRKRGMGAGAKRRLTTSIMLRRPSSATSSRRNSKHIAER